MFPVAQNHHLRVCTFHHERAPVRVDPRKAAANLRKYGVSFIVVHCYRADDRVIRIISARKADRVEHRQYEERTKP